jgi:hypothetical protein
MATLDKETADLVWPDTSMDAVGQVGKDSNASAIKNKIA